MLILVKETRATARITEREREEAAGFERRAGLDPRSDEELIEEVAGRQAARLTEEMLKKGRTLDDIINGGAASGWPARIRRRLEASAALVRRADRSAGAPEALQKPEMLCRYIEQRYLPLDVETFGVLLLSTKNTLIEARVISVGGINSTLVDRKRIVRYASTCGVSGIATWHNHPSGDPTPSVEDTIVWRQIEDLMKVLGVEVIDQVIVTRPGGRYYSQKKQGCGPDTMPVRAGNYWGSTDHIMGLGERNTFSREARR